MEKNRLPKLELDGFTNLPNDASYRRGSRTTKRREAPLWKNRAVSIAKKFSAPIKSIRTRTGKETAQETEQSGTGDVDAGYKRLLIKTGVCAAIAITILIISSIDTPLTNSITEAIDDTVSHEFDIDEDIGKLKFVQSLDEDVESVFSALPDAAVVYPADGEIVTAYGESGSHGVRIAPAGTEVVSIARGTVTAVGAIDGMGYVKVVLDAGETAVFYNISPSVLVDDIVMPGQAIGDVVGDYLYIEMTSEGEYIDPIAYIEQRAVLVVQ
ncbi:MAG: peptidoglycan DD-metalloendopeptidase family protein [Eubacteriales bacterium]|nr:peptidoglycan DD-metalloendopeptidase family protein [Eubacteriales bacterium]